MPKNSPHEHVEGPLTGKGQRKPRLLLGQRNNYLSFLWLHDRAPHQGALMHLLTASKGHHKSQHAIHLWGAPGQSITGICLQVLL